MSKVKQELTQATGIRARAKERTVDYLRRLLEYIGDTMSDDEYEKLSEAAKVWIDAAMDEYNSATEEDRQPNPPEWPEDQEKATQKGSETVTESPTVNEEKEEEEPQKVKQQEKPSTEVKSGGPPMGRKRGAGRNTGKGKNKPNDKAVSVTWRIKQLIISNPKITRTQLEEQLYMEGYRTSQSTITGMLSDFRQSLFVLKEMGKLKDVQL